MWILGLPGSMVRVSFMTWSKHLLILCLGANTDVIKASDFIGLDAYPYFQDAAIGDASNTFWSAVDATRNVVNSVSPGKWVWVTETGTSCLPFNRDIY